MIKLLKIVISGYKMIEDNFTIDFVPKAKVSMDNGNNSNEISEIADNLYYHSLIALTGRNSSGKTTVLNIIRKTLILMSTGRWIYDPKEFNKDSIDIKINFFKDGVIYLYECSIEKKQNNSYLGVESPYSTIDNERILYARYKPSVGRRYEKELSFNEDNTYSTGLKDTGKIVFLINEPLYVYGLNLYSSNGVIVDSNFFDLFNVFNFELTSSIIKLLDESIEYIKYNESDNLMRLKRFNTPEIKLTKEELLSHLSNGTIKGIELYINAIKALKTGGILMIDEIENCFHKNLVNNIFYLFEDKKTNKNNASIIFTTHYVEILDSLSRRDSIFILHKSDKKIKISNLYSDYNVRTEILKSKQFNSNTFDTLLNYNTLMEVKKGVIDEISNND